MDRNW